ncbi:hypothetical protein AKJ56_00470 [candidate division MSBL1 archaeon SCGC-AAA382N08]|uniref:Nudix hydrolase domain-containing protein n=1 Tax=candidate division MSBL1 archaeon SCGC-AAA382N08 TaxID=1698285 RepID=A0A133VQK8_9EURY|nr:hypothetical protein AKJ56_00470 [candidate division MSBL1 archaeon SCGC-AAA382N08]
MVGASAIVQKNTTHTLLVKRLNDPEKGKWALPGGKVDYGETVKQAAIREVKEETNIDIRLVKLLGHYDIIDDGYHYVTICYRGIPKNADIIAGSDVEKAKWISSDNLKQISLTSTTRKALTDNHII